MNKTNFVTKEGGQHIVGDKPKPEPKPEKKSDKETKTETPKTKED